MKKSLTITCWTVGIAVVAAVATYFYRHRYDKYELTEVEQQTVMLEARKEGKTLVLFTTHAGNRFCKTLRTAQELLPTSPIVQGLATHEDDVADAAESVTKWLRDNGFEKQ